MRRILAATLIALWAFARWFDGVIFRLCSKVGRALHWLTGMSTGSIGAILFLTGFVLDIAYRIAFHRGTFTTILMLVFAPYYVWLFIRAEQSEPGDIMTHHHLLLINTRTTWNTISIVTIPMMPFLSRLQIIATIMEMLGFNIATMFWPRKKSAVRRAVEHLTQQRIPAMSPS